jgi:hypothetical protein
MAVEALRKRLALTATAAVAGIVVSTSFDETLGGLLTVGSIVALIFTLHRFGRTGPE